MPMRRLTLLLPLLLLTPLLFGQEPVDSSLLVAPNPETEIETSYDGEEVLSIALAALAVLLAAYFLYRRRKRNV